MTILYEYMYIINTHRHSMFQMTCWLSHGCETSWNMCNYFSSYFVAHLYVKSSYIHFAKRRKKNMKERNFCDDAATINIMR